MVGFLVLVFCIVSLLLIWHILPPKSFEFSTIPPQDEYQVISDNSPALNRPKTQSELELKKAELQKLENETRELKEILAEKEYILQRLQELENSGEWTYEIPQLISRNDELNIILTKYTED